jgi:hypothetical protein
MHRLINSKQKTTSKGETMISLLVITVIITVLSALYLGIRVLNDNTTTTNNQEVNMMTNKTKATSLLRAIGHALWNAEGGVASALVFVFSMLTIGAVLAVGALVIDIYQYTPVIAGVLVLFTIAFTWLMYAMSSSSIQSIAYEIGAHWDKNTPSHARMDRRVWGALALYCSGWWCIIIMGMLLLTGCGDGDHAFRSTMLSKQGYPTHCQRDGNGDGWHTLAEGAKVLYGTLGPCPTCKEVGVVPVYMVGSDTTPEDRDQVFHMYKPAPGSYLDELEKRLIEQEKKVNSLPIEKTWKGSTIFPLFSCMFTMAVMTLRRRLRFTSLGYWLTRPGKKEQCEVKIQGDPHEINHSWVLKAVGFKHRDAKKAVDDFKRHKDDVPAQWMHVEIASATSQRDEEYQARCFNEWSDPGVGDANHYTRCCVSLDEAITMTAAMMISYSWGEADTIVDDLKHISRLKRVARKTFLPEGQAGKARRRIECLKTDRKRLTEVLENKKDMPILQLTSPALTHCTEEHCYNLVSNPEDGWLLCDKHLKR